MIMAKRSRKQIEKDERKVISMLQENARDSIDHIAEECGFSRQKVWRIINRLEEQKKIWGYTAVVDDEKLEQKIFVMLIKKSITPAKQAVDKIVNLTMQKKGKKIGANIEYSMYLHGEYDWLFIFTAPDLKHMKKFSEVLTSEYKDIISDIKILEGIFPVQKGGITNPGVDK
jgi:DNA-binding Lrp family transcriptional regulator